MFSRHRFQFLNHERIKGDTNTVSVLLTKYWLSDLVMMAASVGLQTTPYGIHGQFIKFFLTLPVIILITLRTVWMDPDIVMIRLPCVIPIRRVAVCFWAQISSNFFLHYIILSFKVGKGMY